MTVVKVKPKRAVKTIHKKGAVENVDQLDVVQLCKARLHQDFAECWRKGIAFHYTNEMTRALGTKFFISANPDGSEDLVRMVYMTEPLKSFDDIQYQLEKHLCGKGKGQYYTLLKGLV